MTLFVRNGVDKRKSKFARQTFVRSGIDKRVDWVEFSHIRIVSKVSLCDNNSN